MSLRLWIGVLAASSIVAAGCSCATGDNHGSEDTGLPDARSLDGAIDGSRDGGDAHVDVGLPDGAIVLPDGAVIFPDGGALPDGAIVLPDGAVIFPDGGGTHDGGACSTDTDCEDGYSCTVDSCVGGSCSRTIAPTACADDGVVCNGGSACAPTSALADATTGCAPTPPPDCDDHASCTTDSCDEAAHGCVNTPVDTTCDDGVFCTGAERCAPGTTGADAQGCVAGASPTCDDGFACTTDTCSATTDACVFTPTHSACDDGLTCDGAEQCNPTSSVADTRGCVAGTTPSCDDGVMCTVDTCNEAAGGCTHTTSDTLCGDGIFCDGVEQCSPAAAGADARGCIAGTVVSCPSDGFACTVEACNEAAGACASTPDSSTCAPGTICTAASGDPATGCTPGRSCTTSAECDDGNVCNGAETCVGGGCRAGTNLVCADTVSCTVDSCDPTLGCQHLATDSICDDHLVCNGIESCSATLGCQAGTAPSCGDTFSCTADSCSESAGGCVHAPNNAACSNGVFCDGVEQCVVGAGCTPGAAPTCSDGIACTTDACSGATDACVHTAVNAACDNGLYCDGVETCSATLGCVAGMAVNCNDGLACSDDSCIEATDSCDHSYNAANCPSGQVCTASGCAMGRACTGPTASVCDDGQFCNGMETCSSATSVPGTCQPGTVVDCNDSQTCSTDLCSNALAMCTYTAWDRDGDGYQDLNCLGLGTDCEDLDATIHPGATETCDGVDRNCDGFPNNHLRGNGQSCTSGSMCCNATCTSGICTLPPATCRRTEALCTTSADCCSGRCAVGVDGARRCQVAGGCSIGGEACLTAADCCSTACVGGFCADGPACRVRTSPCTSNAQCCSNICMGGTCQAAGSGCNVDGEICSSSGSCCSGWCVAPASGTGSSHCSTHDTCRAEGELCTTGSDCCTGGCDPTTHRCEFLGSCSSSGEPCTGQRDCCSALCADAGSGVRICQHLDGCRPYGEICTSNGECCSSQCSTPDAIGVRRCVNPPGCVDAGEICAQGGSDDCCVLRHRGCEPTGLGVSRCNDSDTCIMLGQTCDFSAQCCNGADCLLDASGVRRCANMCIASGGACLADSDCCEGTCLDGSCNPSTGGCTPLGDACTASSDCCSLNCDGVCYP